MKNFDLIVIGAGSAGLTVSIGSARLGKKVLLIEKDLMGGDCTNFGCIPSKSLLHNSRDFKRIEDSLATNKKNKFEKEVFFKVQNLVKKIRREESPKKLEKEHKNLTVVKGAASFVSNTKIKVSLKGKNKYFSAKKIVIATGSSPRDLNIKGLPSSKKLNNKTVFNLKKAPKNLLIIGAGAIAVELAEAFNNLGTKVSLIVRGETLLKTESSEVSKALLKDFKASQINIFFNSTVSSCTKTKASIKNSKNNKKVSLDYDYILLATGRIVDLESLKLKKAGVKFSEKGVSVNKNFQTSQKNIFAIGDCSSAIKLTHVADEQGRFLVKKLFLPFSSYKKKPVPSVIYTKKEISKVGLTFKEAQKIYPAKEIIKLHLSYNSTDRAKTDELNGGEVVLIAKKITGKILGANIYGRNSGELISFFTLAMQNKISLWKINKVIFPYPSLSRIIKKISDQFLAKSAQNLKKDIFYYAKKHVPKLLTLLFWILLFSYYLNYKTTNSLTNLEVAKSLFSFVSGTIYGPLAYILFYTFRPLIFFPATLLTVLGGVFFGPLWGVVYTVIGANLTATFGYILGRILGSGLISNNESSLLNHWKQKIQKESFISIFIMRLIFLPFDGVNYFAGIVKAKWAPFALATFLGTLPGTASLVSFGASIENIDSMNLNEISLNPIQVLIAFSLFFFSLLLSKFFKKQSSQSIKK